MSCWTGRHPNAIGFFVSLSTGTIRKKQFLLKMLLASETDLAELINPMAFPVLGRGRVLYALVGKNSEHTIGVSNPIH